MIEKKEPRLYHCFVCDEDKTWKYFSNTRSPRKDGGLICRACANVQSQERLQDQFAAREQEKAAIVERKRATSHAREVRNRKRLQAREAAREQVRKERAQKRAAKKAAKGDSVAAKEYAKRVLARRHLLPFVTRFQKNYLAGWVHKDICARLEKFSREVAEGKSPRLMLQMPPRLGKSTIASHYFPGWHLGKHPEHEIITCSYSGSLAMGFSRKVRGLLDNPRMHSVFPKAKLDKKNQNAEGWMTTEGGGFVPAGVGGAITGKGAHVLIIDDPVKNAEEAESQTVRDSTYDWYTSTAYTRLAPGGGVLIIQTRWHGDDLSGRLERFMDEAEGDDFEIVRYPAIATEDEDFRKKGEALHPERYNEEAYARIKKAVGPRVWASLYQQTPTEEEGSYFNISMMRPCVMADIPNNTTNYCTWDFAISQKDRADYTVGLTAGLDEDENLWLRDLTKGRLDTWEIIDEILGMFELWNPDLIGLESGHIMLALKPLLEKEIEDRAQGRKKDEMGLTAPADPRYYNVNLEELAPGRRDKELRARAIQGRMKQGKVYFPVDAPWYEELKQELLAFPFGNNDDMVDALAWLGLMLLVMNAPQTDKPKPKKKREGWNRRLKKLMSKQRHGTRSSMGA